MPSIYLKQTTGTYNAGSVSVSVESESYSHSNLFTRYKHTLTPTKDGDIWIFNDKHNEWRTTVNDCLTLTRDNGYTDAKLKEAHVYYNQYDKKTPLLLVLIFENGGPTGENKYYKWSEFKNKFSNDGGQSVNISDLTKYNGDDTSILDVLIGENDSLPEPLTFNIGRTNGEGGNGNGGSTNQYNNKKICVQDESSKGQPTLSGSQFRRYKHIPALGGGNESKKACVIYNYNLLINESKNPIDTIQEKTYNYICVYYSDKVFEPLLVEFKENGSLSNTTNYYYHTWKNGNDDDNKELYWKEIKQSSNVLDVQLESGSTDVYTTLTESGGRKLLEVLRAIETHLQKTIVFMIDKFCKLIENISTINLDC